MQSLTNRLTAVIDHRGVFGYNLKLNVFTFTVGVGKVRIGRIRALPSSYFLAPLSYLWPTIHLVSFVVRRRKICLLFFVLEGPKFLLF